MCEGVDGAHGVSFSRFHSVVRLGVEVDALPVVHVRQEGVVVGVPDGGADEGVLVHRLGVAERHAVGVHKLHHLWAGDSSVTQGSTGVKAPPPIQA